MSVFFFFFFSSRRRHTRCGRDWSSDVCSSDLAAAAWADEEHVTETRERYRAKRDALLPALLAAGLQPSGGDASFFLWLRVPGGEDAEAFALRLLNERGIAVAPGPYFGPGGEGHVRIALVPTLADCRRAADLLASGA